MEMDEVIRVIEQRIETREARLAELESEADALRKRTKELRSALAILKGLSSDEDETKDDVRPELAGLSKKDAVLRILELSERPLDAEEIQIVAMEMGLDIPEPTVRWALSVWIKNDRVVKVPTETGRDRYALTEQAEPEQLTNADLQEATRVTMT